MAAKAPRKKPASTGVKQAPKKDTRFKPGQSGNPAGRKPGTRNVLSEDFIRSMAEDFAKHGVSVIADVRENNPKDYLKLVADLVPKDFNVKHDAGDAFLSLWSQMGGGRSNT